MRFKFLALACLGSRKNVNISAISNQTHFPHKQPKSLKNKRKKDQPQPGCTTFLMFFAEE
jgi:hypothetical protein